LRNDPSLASSLAGEYANLNKQELEQSLGREPSRADLYMAHFLGAAGATSFLKALETKGGTSAAALLPDAAASNPGIFYDSAGRARSVSAIYATLGGRIEQAANSFDANSSGVADADGADPYVSDALQIVPGGTASLSPRLAFAGVNLTPPVASMLDALTLAALKLVSASGAPAPAQSSNTGS